MARQIKPRCAMCKTHGCRDGKDCYGHAEEHLALYDERLVRLHRAASAIEGRHYGKEPRLRETALFAKEMGFKRLGLSFCIGLADEAAVIAEVLSRDFEVISACCKNCGIPKKTLGLEQIDPGREHETMCNPAGQAEMLNEAGTELNIICGLCVGHDAIFTMKSKAPVTTLIAKDRVLGHNPVAAVYCQYVRRKL
ncbi:MAG: hypothetical protein BIFFINMI_01069 [Phycisphaerae bacterium]|nr:hypothetical protein [Phycisphaerae bacterium]